jgi:hypothetical protein
MTRALINTADRTGANRFRRRFLFAASGFAAAILLPQGARADFFKDAGKVLEGVGGLLGGGGGSALSDAEIGAGLKEALRVGSERVIGQVSALDGFNADPAIHIPLPGALRDVQKVLKTIGLSAMADDLELRMNRGAEVASREAKALFWQSIEEMTLDDVRKIFTGPDDAATQYFRGKMSAPLTQRMTPLVEESLAEVGAVRSYDSMMAQYKTIPFVPDAKADLTSYVVEKGLDGIFLYIAKEEAAIRNNPAARTTDLLKKVFG